ncbi:MAG: putative lipoprotein, partial [Verrucomicrobiales bacterium]|nr:putative lipoprotein [Verrucomicrobiales bacterium]
MKPFEKWRALAGLLASVLFTLPCPFCVHAEDEPFRPGAVIQLAGKHYTVKTIEALPCVEDVYTKRFHFDAFENPKLKELRSRYKLDDVIAPGKDEFEKQVMLMDWTHRQFKKFGKPSADAKGALEILQCIEGGHTFFCAHYAKVLVSSAASLGWVDRELALRRHQGSAKDGSSEHSTTEIWSNQHRKWVMLDPTSNMYLEKEGIPLNAWEIRQEWFYHNGTNLTFVIG